MPHEQWKESEMKKTLGKCSVCNKKAQFNVQGKILCLEHATKEINR